MWAHEGYFSSIIKSFYPKGNEKNRKRAFQLLKSDFMQYMSLQHITCTSRLNPNKIILLFKINVSPSMKTKTKNVTEHMDKDELDEHYTTFLAFDAINKDLL